MSYDSALRRFQRELGKRVELKAQSVRNYSVQFCPVDTGRLVQSIHVKKISETEYAVGTNVDYAPHVHFGTLHQAPQAFFTQAIEAAKAE